MAERAESQSGFVTPFTNFMASERRTMSETHLHQAISLLEGETPNCISTHTMNVLSGSMYKQATEPTKILGKFDLFDSKIVVIHKLESNIIDYYTVEENLSGFKTKSSINENKVIQQGEFIIENESNEGVLAIGKNALIALKIHKNTFEDMMQVSKSFAEQTTHKEGKTYDIHITQDYEFVNLSEDENEFIPILPYANGKLLITRKRNEINFSSFSNEKLNQDDPLRNYKEFEGYGHTNVKIYINESLLNDLPNTRTWNWLKEKHQETINHHLDFLNFVEVFTSQDIKLSPNFFNLVNYYIDFVNGFNKFEKRDLICLVRIETDKIVNLKTGSKLTNVFGTKGLIRVVDDSEMPTLEDGTVIDIVINSDTVIGRMNLGSIREMEFNSVRERFEKQINETTNFEKKCEIFTDFMKNLCNLDYDFSKILTENFFEGNFKLIGIMEKFKPEVFKTHKPDILKTLIDPKTKLPYKNKCVVGRNYTLQLKHEPEKKSSAVALAYENAAGFPTRSSKRDYLILGDKPSSLGYMECSHLSCSGNEILDELIKVRSYSKSTREFLAKEMILKDGEISQSGIPMYSNSAKEFFKQIITCLGIDLGL